MNKSKTQPRLLGECELLAEKDQGSDKGRSCAEDFDRYKTQSIGCVTTKFDAWFMVPFCSYKIQNTT